MSRKTVVFNMPAQNVGRDSEPLEGEIAAPGEPDRWVRERRVDETGGIDTPARALLAMQGSVGSGGLSFDLAAERNWSQVVALSLAMPSVLGWFWCANALERYRRLFA